MLEIQRERDLVDEEYYLRRLKLLQERQQSQKAKTDGRTDASE